MPTRDRSNGAAASKGARRTPPRLLIEDWLPTAAIGVESLRERGTGQNPPNARLHVWWARRPLIASRAAVLGSLLPADFPREVFERLLGFGQPSAELVRRRQLMDSGHRVPGGFGCGRAFKNVLPAADLARAHAATARLWGRQVRVLDPMAGGGSIPLEAARLGFATRALDYSPVACSILEATVDYPFRFGEPLSRRARHWASIWQARVAEQSRPYYPLRTAGLVHAYILARVVRCPDTGHPTPLVPDWHLWKPTGRAGRFVAQPHIDSAAGTWTVRVRALGSGPKELAETPASTYRRGIGVSLFSGRKISGEYIKAEAQAGRLGYALYALAIKSHQGLWFAVSDSAETAAMKAAEAELARRRDRWERSGCIPTEDFPAITSDHRPHLYGMGRWSAMFTPRQLLCAGVLVEELRALHPEVIAVEGSALGEAVIHLLALALDKFVNHNCLFNRWENTRGVVKGKMDRHDYAFKPAFAELAPAPAGGGLAWAVDNVLEAYEELSALPRHAGARPAVVGHGAAATLRGVAKNSITAVIVDPPYADNVQYAELADFFYVWLKRTQGHRRREWFSSSLCRIDKEAVVNHQRHSPEGKDRAGARRRARQFYQDLLTRIFREARRVLRPDGVLTIMFTHKKPEAWAALGQALMAAGFRVTAAWPVRTESKHSLHLGSKNAAQCTVLLVARKRPIRAAVGCLDAARRRQIRALARRALRRDDLNAVDQLAAVFGSALAVCTTFSALRSARGTPIRIAEWLAVAEGVQQAGSTPQSSPAPPSQPSQIRKPHRGQQKRLRK